MTVPSQDAPADPSRPSIARGAVWIAIGALIAAAIVCVVWVLIGPQDGIVGRAFLTILLLAAFAGAALFDTHMAPRRPAWYALASMVAWVIALLAGAVKIWMPEDPWYYDFGLGRFFEFVAIVIVLRLALLHIRLYLKSHARYVTTFTQIIAYVTIALVLGLAVMLIIPLVFSRTFEYGELYWRFVVALTILAAVGTALIPLINALNAPRKPAAPRPVAYQPAYAAPVQQQWPTYVDGVTPLPVLPDGSPDWNAYYTGYPTVQPVAGIEGAQPAAPIAASAAPAAPVAPEYPAVPPLPPRPPQP